MVFEILRLNKKNSKNFYLWCYSSVDRVLGWEAGGPQFDSQEGINFFT